MSGGGNDEDSGDRTVFGQPLPQAQPQPVRPTPVQTPLHQVKPLTPPATPAAPLEAEADDGEKTIIGARLPDLAPGPVPAAPTAKPKVAAPPKVSLRAAARTSGRTTGKGSNPMLAAASDILGLLGRLRTGMVDMPGAPLRDHLRTEIARFDERCEAARLKRADIDDARYALAATCDDIARTLPGSDPAFWKEHALVKTLFNDTDPSAGFFDRYELLLTRPAKRAALLELMLVCLSLGYQGEYRHAPDGIRALATLRKAGYERLRNAVARPAPALSKKWLPVVLRGRRLRPLLPLWIVAGVAAAMVVALFASFAWILTNEAQDTQNSMIALHRPLPDIDIARVRLPDAPQVVVYQAPPSGQVDRVREALAPEITQGLTSVQEEGDFIAIRLGDALRFGPGAPTLETESPVLARIAQVLEGEPGTIIIEGHSDNIPLSGRGRYKTNEALSEARAATVRDALAPYLSDPARMSVIGVGPSKPLDTGDTPEARARNRRVDILLRKEQQL